MTYRCVMCHGPVEIDPPQSCCGEMRFEPDPDSVSFDDLVNMLRSNEKRGVRQEEAYIAIPYDIVECFSGEDLRVAHNEVYAADEPKDPQHWKEEL